MEEGSPLERRAVALWEMMTMLSSDVMVLRVVRSFLMGELSHTTPSSSSANITNSLKLINAVRLTLLQMVVLSTFWE